jgi:hypothetical protein
VQIGGLTLAIAAASLETVIVTDQIVEVKMVTGDSILVKDVFSYCRGDVVARMAIEKWNAGEKNIWGQLEPMYLKDFIIRAQMKLEK